MKLSNANMIAYKVFCLTILAIFAVVIFVFDSSYYFRNGQHIGRMPFSFGFAFLLIASLVYYILFGRFYKVFFDDNYLYYSTLLVKEKVPLKDIVKISRGLFPYKLFIFFAYPITLKLANGRKIKCLSKEIDFGTSLEDNLEYKLLIEKVTLVKAN